jgi:peptidyl-prolyl cis-trans isomerase B (cyclophilin B)
MTIENLTRREFVATSLGALGAAALAGCSGNGAQKGEGSGSGAESTSSQPASDDPYATGTHHATIVVEGYGTIECALNANVAPITVANFCKLANEGFYDGLTFHRVIEGFMIQGGDPQGTGMGGPGWHIKGEFLQNGVANPIKHTRGVISMARSMDPNSAGSQFFIMHQDAPHLDGSYAAFGHVVKGIEVVDEIAAVATDWNDKPRTPVVMEKVEIV